MYKEGSQKLPYFSLSTQIRMIFALFRKTEIDFSGKTYVQYTRIHCTICDSHLGSAVTNFKDIFIHPLLKVLICRDCFQFYQSEDFERDVDGTDKYCRWCGQGGTLVCCTKCAKVFCKVKFI